jgi:hypothetical protein
MTKQYVAIDLLALLLPTHIYVKFKGPRPLEEILAEAREAVKSMSAKEKATALAHAEYMIACGNAMKKALRG